MWPFKKKPKLLSPSDGIEVLGREKFSPIVLIAGDALVLTFTDNKNNEVLCRKTLTADHAMTVDEGVLFATVFENRRALGGMVLEEAP